MAETTAGQLPPSSGEQSMTAVYRPRTGQIQWPGPSRSARPPYIGGTYFSWWTSPPLVTAGHLHREGSAHQTVESCAPPR